MTTGRDILRALEGLPMSALEQVKDFIIFTERNKGLITPSPERQSACEEAERSHKKWAGTNLGPGFSGREKSRVSGIVNKLRRDDANQVLSMIFQVTMAKATIAPTSSAGTRYSRIMRRLLSAIQTRDGASCYEYARQALVRLAQA